MMPSPRVSYIVSAFDRPRHLRGCLSTLQVQTDGDFEVIVADNGPMGSMEHNREIVEAMVDERFHHYDTGIGHPQFDCYWSSDYLIERGWVRGEWLCFPSDDSLYLPPFQETLLKHADVNGWDLVFPEMLYDRRIHGKYAVINSRPSVGGIDKTGFMIRRSVWPGWPGKNETLGASCCDGVLVEQMVASGVKWGKVEEILCVHN